jgi:hypothetical protein
MATVEWTGRWDDLRGDYAGRTYRTSTGETRYQIDRQVQGKRYSLTLPASSIEEARIQLAAFLLDPVAYKLKASPAPAASLEELRLDAKTIQEVLDHLRERQESEGHRATVKSKLLEWEKHFAGRPASKWTSQEIRGFLEGKPAFNYRLAALKAWARYFVERERLSLDNAVARTKVKPTPAPARLKQAKLYQPQEISAFYKCIDSQLLRDIVRLCASTGVHLSEVSRVASGDCELRPVADADPIAAVLRFVHKSRFEHSLSLDAAAFAAAQRVAGRHEAIDKDVVRRLIRDACKAFKASGLPGFANYPTGEPSKRYPNGRGNPHAFKLGWLRHSYISAAYSQGRKVTPSGTGVDLAEVQGIVGHRSKSAVTRANYVQGTPALIQIPALRLEHPDDPTPLRGARRRDSQASSA